MPAADDAAGDAAEIAAEGRHATNLELFLDLVFVFAVTQVATYLAGHLDWAGAGRGLLLAWLVWWLWSQFTWLGTAVDLGSRSLAQYQVLAAVPLALLMAVAIPGAYGPTGTEFAGAYLAVNLWSLAIQGPGVWSVPAQRAAWLRYLPLASLAPLMLLAGSFVDGSARVAVWAAVAAFNVGSALAAGGQDADRTREWRIDPTHFAERHALFVIISLGEVLVAVGSAAAGVELVPEIGIGLLATVSLACVFWWTYFAYVPDVVEQQLAGAAAADRGRVARDLFTFGHFPLVAGLVLYAVVAKHLVPHPTAPLALVDRWVLAGAVALFVGGLMGLQFQSVRRFSRERAAAVVVVAGLVASLGPHLDGWVVVALVASVLAGQQTVTLRSYDRWVAEAG